MAARPPAVNHPAFFSRETGRPPTAIDGRR
jgi:hypothetical protein